ncbi:MAG TPA: 16S rRNA (adenine(1518)-N(6)/adenine(1519)-N(6))-dimethyltransferase RsmA [Gemmataceae bacterium]|nr:16S rRNA (adenine(1518)-N(6)/adenine(1519)-N(6))-dimethyltransferase RsmA [Gemmataceae bacterium]
MVPEPSARQTLTYLRGLMEARGIHPKNKLGQNFLIDLNLLALIVRTAELSREDLVLEVGSGTGSLTTRLAEHAGAVLSVEIDPDFFDLAGEVVAGQPHVVLLHADILKNKNTLNAEVLAKLGELQKETGCLRRKLVANLPYAVATPVIANFLVSDCCFERMVVMVQWEIAERLLAHPGSKEYGALSVLVQSLADVETVRRQLPPGVFWPRPQVASAIVCIRPSPAKREQVGDVLRFRNFLRDLYTHRRKNLRGALVGSPRGRREKADVDQGLARLGLDPSARAEDLGIEQHQQLCAAFG